jgi:hypothetical protein
MIRGNMQRMLALDGEDGAGKSVLARRFAEKFGGRYVKPFAGELGDLIAWSWRTGRFSLADEMARAAITRIGEMYPESDLLVFDRHWITMFTVLPGSFHSGWTRIPTVLCWTTPENTVERLTQRGEETDLEMHRHWCRVFREIAEDGGMPVLDTTQLTPDMGLAALENMVRQSFPHILSQ